MTSPLATEVARVQAPAGLINAAEILAVTRDIPRTCICDWVYQGAQRRWKLVEAVLGCPWHGKG
jgi:hypothetical protein